MPSKSDAPDCPDIRVFGTDHASTTLAIRQMTINDRVRAAWQGLFEGDRNGGPTAMALQLASSLDECGRFDANDVLRRYRDWFDREGFDTGRVAAGVFEHMRQMENMEAVVVVDRELGGMTAGCNPAHRALPLALAIEAIPDEQLEACAIAEARLTHQHPLAADISAAYLTLVRILVRGEPDFERALQLARIGRSMEVQKALTRDTSRPLDQGGFAPEALRAAIHFVRPSLSPEEAIESAIRFAGPANYCPVLAGPLIRVIAQADTL